MIYNVENSQNWQEYYIYLYFIASIHMFKKLYTSSNNKKDPNENSINEKYSVLDKKNGPAI